MSPFAPPSPRTSARRPALVRAAALLAAGLATGALAGCGAGPDGTGAHAAPSATGSLPSLSGSPAPTATSDVVGRAFDVGTVTRTATVGGVLTIELDRWTVKGMSDSALASKGMPVRPHTGTLVTNQNDDRTRTVPVAPGARLVVNTCVTSGEGPTQTLGMTSDPQPAADWLQDPDPRTVLLLTYDRAGRVVRLDTDPVC